LIQAGGEIFHSKMHDLINSLWNKEELPDQLKESIIEPTHRKGDNTQEYSCYQLNTKFYSVTLCQG
jgi:hypothetical protein